MNVGVGLLSSVSLRFPRDRDAEFLALTAIVAAAGRAVEELTADVDDTDSQNMDETVNIQASVEWNLRGSVHMRVSHTPCLSCVSAMLQFQKKFPDAKILYMIRDPLQVIPSGLSLVTGVLDKRFHFWSLNESIKKRFIERLYGALVELLIRFHEDWENGNINKEKVFIIRFDSMMNEFDILMDKLLGFLDVEKNDELLQKIKETSEDQKQYKSGHKYDLKKFDLTENIIRNDCKKIYDTFLK